MKKVLIYIVLASIFLVFSFCVYVFFNGDDDVLNNDAHLMPVVKQAADNQNSWILLKQAEEAMYYPGEKKELIKQLIDGSRWDQKFAQELVERNQGTYESIARALKRNYFIAPTMSGIDLEIADFNVEGRQLIERKINRLLLVNAIYQIRIGNIDESIEIVLDSLELGYKIRNKNNPTLIDCISGLAVNKQTYFVINTILNNKISDVSKKMLVRKLDLIKNNEWCLVEAYKWEYLLMKSSVLSMVETDNHLEYYFKPQQTINLYNEYYTQSMQGGCDEKSSLKNWKGMSKLRGMITENAVGKILYSLLPDINNLNQRRCEELVEIDKLQLRME